VSTDDGKVQRSTWRSRRLTPTGAKFVSDVIGRLLLLLLFVLAARMLSTADFGGYAYALAIGLLLGQLADAGIGITLLRSLAAESDSRARGFLFWAATAARSLLTAPLFFVAAVLAAGAGSSPERGGELAIVAATQMVGSFGDLWIQLLRERGRLDLEAVVGLASRATILLIGALMLTAGLGLLGLAVAHLLGTGIGVIAAQLLTRRMISWRPALRIPDVARMLVAAFPVGAAAALSLLMFRVDVVLLEALRGPEPVAAFSAAHRLYEAAVLLPAAVMAGTFPALARSMADLVAFRQRIREVAVLLATYGVAATLAGWLLAPIVVPLIFGSSYAGSGQLLQVMVLAVPFLALNALLTQALIAVRRAWREAAAVALALAVAVAVNLALIPSLGAVGAAGAVVAGEAALLLGCLIALAGLRPYGNNSSASR